MSTKLLATMIMAGAAAGAVALAPAAGANTNTMECAEKGSATLCQKTGHSSMNVSPGSRGGGPANWPFDASPATPPIWAMS